MAPRPAAPPRPSVPKPGPRRRRARPDSASDSLIDWTQPDRHAHALDWRPRAHEFGIVPSDDTDEAVVLPPRQLVEEDDPEAFEDQIMAEDGDEPLRSEAKSEDEEEDAAPPPGTSREDLDLVRVYLKHVGRRKLLKAKEEQEIGERIEKARGELQAMLGMIPCAVRTLLALADEVRKGAPAAELILLQDGGELKQDRITPVLKAFERIRQARQKVDACMRKCEDKRSTTASRAGYRKEIEAADLVIGNILRELPLRPSLVEDITNKLREKNAQFDALEQVPRPARTAARHELEQRNGLPRRRLCEIAAGVRLQEEVLREAMRDLPEANYPLAAWMQ